LESKKVVGAFFLAFGVCVFFSFSAYSNVSMNGEIGQILKAQGKSAENEVSIT
jgi:hypothetical protein